MFQSLIDQGVQVAFQAHAEAILSVDFPDAIRELEAVLGTITISIEEIVGSGGGEAKSTQRIRRALAALGWGKEKFIVEKTINGIRKESQSHEVDHVRRFDHGVLALEIEWNNKDPFFDRDLENFKRLHAEGGISLGIIVTRGESLQAEMPNLVRRFAEENHIQTLEDLVRIGLNPTTRQKNAVNRRTAGGASFAEVWSHEFVADKYGSSTTHWRKLKDRIQRGVGNPCPLVLIGLPSSVVAFTQMEPDTQAGD